MKSLAQVNIQNGEGIDCVLTKDGTSQTVTLTAQEQTDLSDAVAQMQTLDDTNCEWLIVVDNDAEQVQFDFTNATIDNNKTCCLKGAALSEEEQANIYTPLKAVVDSILSRT